MDSPSNTEDSRNANLLLKTSETILHMAQIARKNGTSEETKIPCSYLMATCLKFSVNARQPSDAELIKKALEKFNSLIYGMPEFSLQSLNDRWDEIRQHNDEMTQFVKRWIGPETSRNHFSDVVNELEKCADELDKQHQQRLYYRSSTEKPALPDMDECNITKVAQSIFEALSNCKKCSCSRQHEIGAELGLSTYRKNKTVDNVTRPGNNQTCDKNAAKGPDFDMFFSKEKNWHQFCVQVTSDMERSTSNKVDELCQAISKIKSDHTQILELELIDDNLFLSQFKKRDLRIDNAAEPISLAQCFENHIYFTEKIKRIISLIIAYTVFHLCGTPWLQPGWGSETITFFQTIADRKIPVWPFMQIVLSKDATPDSPCEYDRESLEHRDSQHCYPALVTLAVVLMEVNFGKPFRELAKKRNVEFTKKSNGCIRRLDADQVYYGVKDSNLEGWELDVPMDSPIRRVIDSCLNAEFWEGKKGKPLDIEKARAQIYSFIVQPLREYLAHGFTTLPLDGIDKCARKLDLGSWVHGASHELNGYTTAKPQEIRPTLSPSLASSASIQKPTPTLNAGSQTSRFFDDIATIGEASQTRTKDYQAWKERYEDVYKKFIEDYADPPSQPVKIAILDTGIDLEHSDIQARKENIEKVHNCYDESQKSVQDLNGHGTFAASLILDYTKDAQLYIIKIADKENASPNAEIAANAIWKALQWGVDIISMSFGWPSSDFKGHNFVEDVIDKAYSEKVLMFAAASNDGGRLGRAYPASSPHVICIHSTDTYGNRSKFSPTAEANTNNIATVGEFVESAWPTNLCQGSKQDIVKSRSGTSYATPIVAGIAAFLLQYARLHLKEENATKLKRKENMEAVLIRCAKHGLKSPLRDGYDYVELSLYNHNLFGKKLEEINYEILEALKK